MIRKLFLVTLVFFVMAGIFLFKTLQVYTKGRIVPETVGDSVDDSLFNDGYPDGKRKNLNDAYESIVSKNLFSPARREVLVEKEVVEIEEKPAEAKKEAMPGKKILLYGIVEFDDVKSALITNPQKDESGKKVIWVKDGEIKGEVRIASILKDRIHIRKDGELYEIALFDDEKKSPTRETKEETAPTVITTEKKTTRNEKSDENLDDGEYVIVDTPFGKLKRRKQ